MQLVLKFLTHGFGPGLGTENTNLELEIPDVKSLLANLFGHIESVGWGAGYSGCAKVLHKLQLFLGVAAAGGDYGAANLGYAVMGAQTAGEKAVTV